MYLMNVIPKAGHDSMINTAKEDSTRSKAALAWEGLMTGNLIDLGFALGVFPPRGGHGTLSIDELMASPDLNSSFVQRWLEAMIAFGLIEPTDSNRFRATDLSEHLTADGPVDVGSLDQPIEYLLRQSKLSSRLASFLNGLLRPSARELVAAVTLADPSIAARLAKGGAIAIAGPEIESIKHALGQLAPDCRVDGFGIGSTPRQMPKLAELVDADPPLDAWSVFDLIVCLPSIDSPETGPVYRNLLERARRALKPDGLLVLSTPSIIESEGSGLQGQFARLLAAARLSHAKTGDGLLTTTALRNVLPLSRFIEQRRVTSSGAVWTLTMARPSGGGERITNGYVPSLSLQKTGAGHVSRM
jgi:hypothetical protein